MKRILINATNLTGWGSSAVGLSLLPELLRSMPDDSFVILAPDEKAYRDLEYAANARVLFYSHGRGFRNDLARLKELVLIVPKIARREKIDVCLTLGDLNPLRLPCPHVLFVQQPLLAYTRREQGSPTAWGPIKDLFIKRYFAETSRGDLRMIVQTPIMAERLARHFEIDPQGIEIIPQPVPSHLDQTVGSHACCSEISACDKPIKLLFLAAPYPHKNHAILPRIAEKLRSRGLASEVQIFVTIDIGRPGIRELIKRLEEYPDVLTNLGRLPGREVAPALKASSALFLPTMVESYGLIYLETMACGRPILTSDRDFARWMCRDLAMYFNPTEPDSIVDKIALSIGFPDDPVLYARQVSQRLSEFPRDWREVAISFRAVISRCATL